MQLLHAFFVCRFAAALLVSSSAAIANPLPLDSTGPTGAIIAVQVVWLIILAFLLSQRLPSVTSPKSLAAYTAAAAFAKSLIRAIMARNPLER